MAGSLIKIDEEIVTSAVSSVLVSGIDSTYDVYCAVAKDIEITVDTAYLQWRVVKDVASVPTVQSTANYDYAAKTLKANTTFGNFSNSNQTRKYWAAAQPLGNAAGEKHNAVVWLFNFNNASEYSFCTVEESVFSSSASTVYGDQGGFVYTVAEAHSGLAIVGDATSIDGGTFTLYGLKK